MATQLYPKLESWWSESFQSLSLENIEAIPIFFKLSQIKGEFCYSFREFRESFTEINGIQELNIEMLDGKNKEIARFKPDDKSRSYYKLFQFPDYEYEIQCEWTDRCETGIEIKRESDRISTIKWQKILDVHSNQEYFPESDVVLYIYKLTEEEKEEGLHKTKTTSTSFHLYEKNVEKETVSKKTIKYRKINKRGRIDILKTIKNDETTIFCKKKTQDTTQETQKRITKDQTIKHKITEFLHNHSKIITSKEITKNSITGHKKYSTNQLNNFYEINWAIENLMFFCEIDVVADSCLCFKKRILYQENEFLEMEDIKSDNDNWGCINRHFENSTFHLKWTGLDSQIYDFHIQRFSSIISKEIQGPPDTSLYRLVQLATVDTEYVYENLETIEKFNFHYFSGLSKVVFQDQSLLSYIFPETLLEKFQEREDYRKVFLENSDKRKFREFVLNYSDVNNKTLLVEEYYRLEKFMSFILKSANLQSKVSYSRNFCLDTYFKIQTWIFDLEYNLELIQMINNSSDAQSIQLERKGFIDQSCFSVICTVCNAVCHRDCRIESQQIDLGNRKIKECSRLQSFHSKCSACKMNCPAFYHANTMKSIRIDHVSLSSTEFNHSYEQAEGFISRFKENLAENDLAGLIIMKLNQFVLVCQKFLNKSRDEKSDSSDSSSDILDLESDASSEKKRSLINRQLILKEIELALKQISILDEIS